MYVKMASNECIAIRIIEKSDHDADDINDINDGHRRQVAVRELARSMKSYSHQRSSREDERRGREAAENFSLYKGRAEKRKKRNRKRREKEEEKKKERKEKREECNHTMD